MIRKILICALTIFLLALAAIFVALAVEFGTPYVHAQDDILQQQARAAIRAHRDNEAIGLVTGVLSQDLVDVHKCAFSHVDVVELTKVCGPQLVTVLKDCLLFLGIDGDEVCKKIVGNAAGLNKDSSR